MPKSAAPFDPAAGMLNAWAINHRINLYLLNNLPAGAWRAATLDGKGRTIASIAAHIHNVRRMWLQAVGVNPLPVKLEPENATLPEVQSAMEASTAAIADVLKAALAGDGRVKGFKPDASAFFAYLISHDGHHRGQIALLARQMGHPLPKSAGFGLWEWGTR